MLYIKLQSSEFQEVLEEVIGAMVGSSRKQSPVNTHALEELGSSGTRQSFCTFKLPFPFCLNCCDILKPKTCSILIRCCLDSLI